MQPIAEGKFDGLDTPVPGQNAVFVVEIEAFEDVKRHQSNHALPVRRDLPNVITSVVHRYRVHPLRLVAGEVFFAQESVVLP